MGHVHGGDPSSPSASGPFFTTDFIGMFFLFEKWPLSSPAHLAIACLVTAVLALLERTLTYLIDRAHYSNVDQNNHAGNGNQDCLVYIRRVLFYLIAVFLRYVLMLLAMSFNLYLFFTVILSLTLGQAVIEWLHCREAKHRRNNFGMDGLGKSGGMGGGNGKGLAGLDGC